MSPGKKAASNQRRSRKSKLTATVERFAAMSKETSGAAGVRALMNASSVTKNVAWTSAEVAQIHRVVEHCMIEVTYSGFHPTGTTISHCKAYLWWAVFDFLRSHEALVDSAGVGITEAVMPKFKECNHIPRPLAKLLEYWAPYVDPSGATAKKILVLPAAGALPVFTSPYLNIANTNGIDFCISSSLWRNYVPASGNTWETTFVVAGAVPTWPEVFTTYAAVISDWYATYGGLIFSFMMKVKSAPDASLHAQPAVSSGANGSHRFVVCPWRNFNSEVAVLLNGAPTSINVSDVPFTFMESIPATLIETNLSSMTGGPQIALTTGFVRIMNSLSKYKRGRIEWCYRYSCYTGVSSISPIVRQMDLTRWHQLQGLVIQQGLMSENSIGIAGKYDIVNIIGFLLMVWEACLINRVNQSGGYVELCGLGSTGNIDLSQWILPGAGYEGVALPAMLADYVASVGPVVAEGKSSGRLVIPCFDFGTGQTAPGSYDEILFNILLNSNVAGGGGNPNAGLNLRAKLTVVGLTANNNFRKPYQFAVTQLAACTTTVPYLGSAANTNATKPLTMAAIGRSPGVSWSPIMVVDLLNPMLETIASSGAALGAVGNATGTYLKRRRFEAPSFVLPKPIGGSCTMLGECLFVATTINWSTTSGTMDTTSTAIALATGDPTYDQFYFLLPSLRIQAVGSCAQWDQHQTGRIIAFAMFSSNSTRMDGFPYVVQVGGSDSINSAVTQSMSEEFCKRYQAEKDEGQEDVYAVRGALAPCYTALAPKAKFSPLQKEEFLRRLVRNIQRFHVAPYYFKQGAPTSESGSWDWLQTALKWITPVADVIAAPFGMSGVVNAVSGGLMSLLEDDTKVAQKRPPPQPPASARPLPAPAPARRAPVRPRKPRPRVRVAAGGGQRAAAPARRR